MPVARPWIAVLCATLLLATPLSADGAPDAAVLRSIETEVSQIRGLAATTEPTLNVLDHESLHRYLADEFDRDYLPSERESDQKELVALGLLQPSDDLVQIQLDLLTDQVIGVYDPDRKALIVVGDQGDFGPAERMTYAHEFNHALQDQHYDLNHLAPKHATSNDQSLAAHALIEGDAILLQTLWASSNLSQDELFQVARATSGVDDNLARVPLVVRAELLFPYVEGFSFVRSAYRRAGNSFAGVDELFTNPPASTAQLLHFDKYRDQIQPLEVRLPDLVDRLGPDWRRVGGGVLGELDTRVLLERWGADHADAARVASGWAGDRWQLVENNGQSAIVLKSTWDSPEAASDFFSAYARGLQTRFDSARTEESTSARQALTSPTTATDLRLHGTEVQTVIAFDRDTANAIVAALEATVQE